LGPDNVRKNANVTSATRKYLDLGSSPYIPYITLHGYNTKTLQGFEYTCNDLIVAFPPKADAMKFLNLDPIELAVFNKVKTRYYFDGTAEVSGPITVGKGFSIRNADPSEKFKQPSFPAVITLARKYPFGPATILASSDTPITTSEMNNYIDFQLARIPSSLLNATRTLTIAHTYQPYPIKSAINHPGGWFSWVKGLQGYRHTYYVGSAVSYSGSYLVIENAYDLINLKFQSKNN